MLKVFALALVVSSVTYCAYTVWSQPKKKSKTAILISQAEQSITDAQVTMKNAEISLQKIQANEN